MEQKDCANNQKDYVNNQKDCINNQKDCINSQKDCTNNQKDYISNSQLALYHTCPYSYYLKYIKKIDETSNSIFTIFGTAMHRTLQEYLNVMFNNSVKKADSLSLKKILQEQMIAAYNEAKEKSNNKKNICTVKDLTEAYLDGVEIIDYFLKKRRKYFSTKQYELLGTEIKLLEPITKNIKFKGYLDIVLRDKKTGNIKIIDLKTSYNGWKDKKKKDKTTRQQLILYKDFYSKKFNIPLDQIEIEYMVLKRKIYSNYDWPIPRIQIVVPPSSARTVTQYKKLITEMIEDVFDKNGQRVDKEYPTRKSIDNCKYCPYKKTKYCPEWK